MIRQEMTFHQLDRQKMSILHVLGASKQFCAAGIHQCAKFALFQQALFCGPGTERGRDEISFEGNFAGNFHCLSAHRVHTGDCHYR